MEDEDVEVQQDPPAVGGSYTVDTSGCGNKNDAGEYARKTVLRGTGGGEARTIASFLRPTPGGSLPRPPTIKSADKVARNFLASNRCFLAKLQAPWPTGLSLSAKGPDGKKIEILGGAHTVPAGLFGLYCVRDTCAAGSAHGGKVQTFKLLQDVDNLHAEDARHLLLFLLQNPWAAGGGGGGKVHLNLVQRLWSAGKGAFSAEDRRTALIAIIALVQTDLIRFFLGGKPVKSFKDLAVAPLGLRDETDSLKIFCQNLLDGVLVLWGGLHKRAAGQRGWRGLQWGFLARWLLDTITKSTGLLRGLVSPEHNTEAKALRDLKLRDESFLGLHSKKFLKKHLPKGAKFEVCCNKVKRLFLCSSSMNHAGIREEGGVGGGREEQEEQEEERWGSWEGGEGGVERGRGGEVEVGERRGLTTSP